MIEAIGVKGAIEDCRSSHRRPAVGIRRATPIGHYKKVARTQSCGALGALEAYRTPAPIFRG
jgi:hypothetical protein